LHCTPPPPRPRHNTEPAWNKQQIAVIAERLRFPTNQTQQAYEGYHDVAFWSRVVVTKKL
jgi:hypothetical protein